MQLRRGCRGAWIALLAALADRLSKRAAAALAPGVHRLVPGIVNLRPVENRGMAFSMLSGQGLFLTILTALLVMAVAGWLLAHPNAPAAERVGTSDEIAEAGAFLLGEHAGFITGTDLLIDGGTIAAIRTGQYKLSR